MDRTTIHFDRATDGRSYVAHEDGAPDITGEGDTMSEALRAWRAAKVARAVGSE